MQSVSTRLPLEPMWEWPALIKTWSEPKGREVLSKAPPESLALGPSLRLLINTEVSLRALQPGVEIKAGAAEAVKAQAVRLLAELFGWVQQNPGFKCMATTGAIVTCFGRQQAALKLRTCMSAYTAAPMCMGPSC